MLPFIILPTCAVLLSWVYEHLSCSDQTNPFENESSSDGQSSSSKAVLQKFKVICLRSMSVVSGFVEGYVFVGGPVTITGNFRFGEGPWKRENSTNDTVMTAEIIRDDRDHNTSRADVEQHVVTVSHTRVTGYAARQVSPSEFNHLNAFMQNCMTRLNQHLVASQLHEVGITEEFTQIPDILLQSEADRHRGHIRVIEITVNAKNDVLITMPLNSIFATEAEINLLKLGDHEHVMEVTRACSRDVVWNVVLADENATECTVKVIAPLYGSLIAPACNVIVETNTAICGNVVARDLTLRGSAGVTSLT